VRRWAVVNLLLILAVGAAAAVVLPEDIFDRNIRLLSVMCGGGSRGLAMALAQQHNQRIITEEHAEADAAADRGFLSHCSLLE
jgi:hypothetical protein